MRAKEYDNYEIQNDISVKARSTESFVIFLDSFRQ